MLYTIENDHFKATLNDLGAELTTLTGKADGYEYIWCGDPAVWSGHSPVLFPFVGKLKDGGFNYQGKRYNMTKHGFARGTVFTVTEQAADRIVFTFAVQLNDVVHLRQDTASGECGSTATTAFLVFTE